MPWDTILAIAIAGAVMYFLMSRVGCGAHASAGAGGGCCGGHAGHDHGERAQTGSSQQGSSAVEHDPVCGMDVAADQAAASFDYGGKTYHFCSVRCRDQFRSDPVRFASKEPLATGGRHEHC